MIFYWGDATSVVRLPDTPAFLDVKMRGDGGVATCIPLKKAHNEIVNILNLNDKK